MPNFPQKYLDAGNVLYKNRRLPFVNRLLKGSNQPVFGLDEYGRPMTHLMSQVDNFAMPLLQYDNGNWTDLRGKSAGEIVNTSLETNNAIEFNSPEEAGAFGMNYHIVMERPELIDYVKRNKKAFQKYIK